MAKVNKFSTPDKNKANKNKIDTMAAIDFIEKGGSVSKTKDEIEKEKDEELQVDEKNRNRGNESLQLKGIGKETDKESDKGKGEEKDKTTGGDKGNEVVDDKPTVVNLRIPKSDLKKIDEVVKKVRPKTDRHKWILGLIYREAKIK